MYDREEKIERLQKVFKILGADLQVVDRGAWIRSYLIHSKNEDVLLTPLGNRHFSLSFSRSLHRQEIITLLAIQLIVLYLYGDGIVISPEKVVGFKEIRTQGEKLYVLVIGGIL
jgi:hypothetical protein